MANERGTAQTLKEVWSWNLCLQGVVRLGSPVQDGHGVTNLLSSRRSLEWAAIEGDSPVGERDEGSGR